MQDLKTIFFFIIEYIGLIKGINPTSVQSLVKRKCLPIEATAGEHDGGSPTASAVVASVSVPLQIRSRVVGPRHSERRHLVTMWKAPPSSHPPTLVTAARL